MAPNQILLVCAEEKLIKAAKMMKNEGTSMFKGKNDNAKNAAQKKILTLLINFEYFMTTN